VIEALQPEFRGMPLITGGRSAGARVACRTAEATGAAGVICLAFPLQPPARASGKVPDSRLGELDDVSVPVLVVQGRNDQFGVPPEGPGRTVVLLDGDHSLKKDLAGVGEAVRDWLRASL
jgi:predicted alpha/beta-hydrolase family hydrolase